MLSFTTSTSVPKSVTAVDLPVFSDSLEGLSDAEREVAALQNFTGKVGQTLLLASPDSGQVRIAVGLGPAEEFGTENLRLAAAAYARVVSGHKTVATTLVTLATDDDRLELDESMSAVVEGMGMASYRFSTYRKKNPVKLQKVSVVIKGKGLRASLNQATTVLRAIELARDLVNEPGGSLLPADFAARAKEVATEAGIKVTVWNANRITKERLGGVLAVSKGSTNEPRFVTLSYAPANATRHLALVGKGVTFDSGGLSIKTGAGMMTMKIDMAGAATVLAAMTAMAELKVPIRVTGYLPLVENMPSGNAQRPGDVFAARNGKTVEVLNTDAEGRLILADALALAAESDADAIIDVATLTGSSTAALGADYAALMATDDDLAGRLLEASEQCGERIWRLPLPPEYRSQLDSTVADLRNIGTGSYAGALIAGLFLKEFVDDKPWAHIDVGVSILSDVSKGWKVKGATGTVVRTLVNLAQGWGD